MKTTRHLFERAAMSFASAADGGFGLVVVDQGNPRCIRAAATLPVALRP